MTREEMYDVVVKKMNSLPKIEKYDMEKRNTCGTADYKQGIYFLYSENDEIIYVGKVGTGENTSLYHRLKGHGGGSHNKKDWYAHVKYGRFYRMANLNETQIEVLERLSIQCNPNKSNYNDKFITPELLDEINSFLQ